jgi:hypothetical protein
VTDVRPLLAPDDIARLRDALATAGYTSAGIAGRIGAAAVEAARRNDLRGLRRATDAGESDDRLATLIRLFLGGQAVPERHVAAALAPLSLPAALSAGLIEPADRDGLLRAGVDLDVYGDAAVTGRTGPGGDEWWLLSDLDSDARPGPLRSDHVLGVGNAATTLAGSVVRRPVGTALDLGTGCGVQSLHLSRHAGAVTATDISPRALRFAATNAALNGVGWELLAGDMLAPVQGRRFDLVVSNPPFVVGPGTTRVTYRDSGRPGDAVCADLAAAAPAILAEGGTLQFLANWLHVAGQDWRERVAGWVGDGCDAWILQREVTDPVDYVDLWLRDAAEASEAGDPESDRARSWLDWFDANKIEAVGFGLVTICRSGRADPVVRVEELRHPVAGPAGVWVAEWFDRQDWLAQHRGPALLDARLARAAGLRLTQEAEYQGADWSVGRQLLTRPDGPRWTQEVDPVALALVSGADGQVALRDQIAVLAHAFDTPEPVLAAMAQPVVAYLVEHGMLVPAE